jgi:hypothetical protein
MDVPLWLALLTVGSLLVSHVGQRRRLETENESLADALETAEARLALAAVGPLTGSSLAPRRSLLRGWTPRPERRVEALRALYGRETGREYREC